MQLSALVILMKCHLQCFGCAQVLDNSSLSDLDTKSCLLGKQWHTEPCVTVPSWTLSLISIYYCAWGILPLRMKGFGARDINSAPSFPTSLWDLEQVTQLL